MNGEKPQAVVLQNTKRIAIGVAVLLGVMLIVYAVLGRFSLAVVLGGLMGSVYAVFNFFKLGMTVQKVAAIQAENADLARMQMKASYNMRMVGLLILTIAAFAIPFIDGLACLIPSTFPRITIFALQITGRVKDE